MLCNNNSINKHWLGFEIFCQCENYWKAEETWYWSKRNHGFSKACQILHPSCRLVFQITLGITLPWTSTPISAYISLHKTARSLRILVKCAFFFSAFQSILSRLRHSFFFRKFSWPCRAKQVWAKRTGWECEYAAPDCDTSDSDRLVHYAFFKMKVCC